MRRSTGIEFAPDSCVLVAARRRGPATEVSALHALEGAAWPSHEVAVTSTLKAARRANRLPRNAAVIVWGLPDDASSQEPSTRAAVRPVVAAGFNVRHVLTPPQALAALAATRPDIDPEAAVAWMALNTYGVALAIVRRGELLFSRTFDWPYRGGVETSKGQLLQRYALVAHLAPELQRGIASVRAGWGATVERAVTCGNLPELRSLTMPLIEELDLEVETLDSIEGLRPVGRAKVDRFAESAPAVRLAAAAAVAPPPRVSRALSPFVRAAAVVALSAGLAWLAWAAFRAQQGQPGTPGMPPTVVSRGGEGPRAPILPPAGSPAQPDPDATPKSAPAQEPAPSGPPLPPPAAVPIPSLPMRPTLGSTSAPATPPPATPVPSIPESAPTVPPAKPPVATGSPPVTAPRPLAQPVPAVPPVTPPVGTPPSAARPATPAPVPPPARSLESQPQVPRILEEVRPLPPSAPAPATRPPAPLKEPLPRIESILIDHTRRLAIIDGRIVGVGDAVGPRVVVRIDAEGVVLREPSGLNVRVPLRDGWRNTGL
jgi:hypothetical protein